MIDKKSMARERKFVCVAGKNDIAVEVLEYLINRKGENSFLKSLR